MGGGRAYVHSHPAFFRQVIFVAQAKSVADPEGAQQAPPPPPLNFD